MGFSFRIGADENGLGARLGPLIVTAVLARIDERGKRLLGRRLPKALARDLGDSKALVSHRNVALGEAWARAIAGAEATSPADLFERFSLEGSVALRAPCPRHVEAQCWAPHGETFLADDETVVRVRAHLARLHDRGVEIVAVRSSAVCTKLLNDGRLAGKNRFVTDLHAMERLVLALRELAGADVHAVCGKVGGMGDYSRFFGPLSYRLHSVLSCERAKSAYRFPGLGEVHFVRDADATDPLVSLASLVGKWVRELLMARIPRFYDAKPEPSGYNDPVTARFVIDTVELRKKKRVPSECFERARDGAR